MSLTIINSLLVFFIGMTGSYIINYFVFKETKIKIKFINVLHGLFFVFVYFRTKNMFNYSSSNDFFMLFSSYLFVYLGLTLSYYDYKTKTVPDWLNVLVFTLGLKYLFLGIFLSAIFYIIYYMALRKKERELPYIPMLFLTFFILWYIHPLELILIELYIGG